MLYLFHVSLAPFHAKRRVVSSASWFTKLFLFQLWNVCPLKRSKNILLYAIIGWQTGTNQLTFWGCYLGLCGPKTNWLIEIFTRFFDTETKCKCIFLFFCSVIPPYMTSISPTLYPTHCSRLFILPHVSLLTPSSPLWSDHSLNLFKRSFKRPLYPSRVFFFFFPVCVSKAASLIDVCARKSDLSEVTWRSNNTHFRSVWLGLCCPSRGNEIFACAGWDSAEIFWKLKC